MDLKLKDKVYVVTGASAGIGAATARLLTDEGARVVAVARNVETVPAGVMTVPADVTDPEAPDDVIATVVERCGRLDGLVNNVGGLDVRNSFLDVTDKQWYSTFDLNFHSVIRFTRSAIPIMLEQGFGSIVHVTSEAARFPDTPIVDYAAAKTALISISKSIAAEFGTHGIRSNIVAPGPTRTRLWDAPGGFADQLSSQFALPVEEAITHFVQNVRRLPTGRLGTPDDVAGVIAYLLSPLARQVTGAEWAIDGGALRQI